MQKITKEKFYDIATTHGLCLVAASGLPLTDIIKQIDLQSSPNRIETAKNNRIICTRKDNKIYRGTSSLTLDGDDTVYQYGKFIIVYTFTAKDNHCSFDSYNTIIYV